MILGLCILGLLLVAFWYFAQPKAYKCEDCKLPMNVQYHEQSMGCTQVIWTCPKCKGTVEIWA